MRLNLATGLLLTVPLTAVQASRSVPRQVPPSGLEAVGSTQDFFLRTLLTESADYGNLTSCRNSTGPFKVGIVGAGAAGLYSAILLQSLGIDYEILELTERIGGRIYTYRFDETAWNNSKPGEPDYYNYYDVGAMRFPGMPWMDRVIGTQNTSIVSYVNSHVTEEADKIRMIPYIFQANNTFRLFNDKLILNQETPSAQNFGVLTSEGGDIPAGTFSTLSPGQVFDEAISDLIAALEADFDTGFNKLMEYDQLSVRQYLLNRNFTGPEIEWIETINDATGHYDDMSLSQAALEQWIFDSAPLSSWQAVDGGMDRMTYGMTKILKNSVITSKRVTAIRPGAGTSLDVVINGTEVRNYAHVINTVPLGVMQMMDLTELKLDYTKRLAIRKLSYDPAGKIGMTFKSRWWESLTLPFVGGQSFSDLPIRRCVYPSYGLNTTDAAGAMIASYTWGQDSSRLGAYYEAPESRAHIINATLRELARMNNVTEDFLNEQFVEAHLYNWYAHEASIGAFALFSPGQFSTLMPALLQPAADGKLHFAGEALSSGHAWIIGALNSAYRSVAEVLAVESRSDLLTQLVQTWGEIDEVDMGWYS
ncbi:hypothetical protein IFR04_009127 [Cadophora malorum]|uniref:Amine oxidase domain-containing protein n=1 Tax=Cadophora malorum TaxID=108018 RepID=A0A8H7TFB2_9HELO|nr:hypothetical protein IFR04_009127 [Cadophora malorum]